ncbi:MAG: hypothetical protein ACYTGC_11430, partial [Planctomycetota bacterium]
MQLPRSILQCLAWSTILLVTASVIADEDIIVDAFDDDVIDFQLWTTVDFPGDGVTVQEINERLEWTSQGGPGVAGIAGRDWAVSTDADFRIIIDYSMTFGNPGATDTGFDIVLFGAGSAAGAQDRIRISIF